MQEKTQVNALPVPYSIVEIEVEVEVEVDLRHFRVALFTSISQKTRVFAPMLRKIQ